MAKRFTSRLLVLSLLFLLVGCDHASKGVAKAELEAGGAHHLILGLLDLRYVENTDIAFNLLRWVPESIRFPALLITGAVSVVGLCVLLLRANLKFKLPMVALVLVTAGAIGNYLDRVVRGYVVDFIHVPHWPVFNVADAYVTVGFMALGWAYLVGRRAQVSVNEVIVNERPSPNSKTSS